MLKLKSKIYVKRWFVYNELEEKTQEHKVVAPKNWCHSAQIEESWLCSWHCGTKAMSCTHRGTSFWALQCQGHYLLALRHHAYRLGIYFSATTPLLWSYNTIVMQLSFFSIFFVCFQFVYKFY